MKVDGPSLRKFSGMNYTADDNVLDSVLMTLTF
jgi:hypothetical protein